MWADGIVVTSPALDHDLSLLQRIEDLPIQQLIAQTSVEALDVAVLPRAAGCDVGRLGADRGDPLPHSCGDKFGTVVRPDVGWHAARDEQIGQHIDHVDRLEFACHPDRQALVRELVEHIEHAILPSVVGAILDEVVGPHVIAMLWSQADARSVRQPQTAALGLLLGDLQPLLSPDPLDPFVVHKPTGITQQGCDLAVAIAAVLVGKLDDVGRQPLLVVEALRRLALRRAVLTERRTRATLGDTKNATDMLDARTPTRRAQ